MSLTRAALAALALLSVPAAARAQGIITTVAGGPGCCAYADGRQATAVYLTPSRVTSDPAGNLYIVDGNFIRRIGTNGIITTIAGTNNVGFGGDGGPATGATLFTAAHMAVDSAGNIYVPDSINNRIRKISATGLITTIAGTGAGAGTGGGAFSGDGGPAINAALDTPISVVLDAAGNIYIADAGNSRVRKIDTNGIITTVAGTGFGFSGDGGPATAAAMERILALAIDGAGNLYISEGGRVRKVDTSGIITRVHGRGRPLGFSGDGGPAVDAQSFGIVGLSVDAAGNLYLVDSNNNRIRKVDTAGIITTIAGNGVFGFSGDGGLSTSAALRTPDDISIDAAGNLYISDTNRIRKVSAGAAFSTSLSLMVFSYTVGGALPASQALTVTSTGAALTFTGSTSASWMALSPGGGTTPATLNVSVLPTGLAPGTYQGTVTLNSSGATARTVNVTLSVTASGGPVTGGAGTISTVAGNGTLGFTGDGGPAPSARLNTPAGVAVDSAGNIYIADQGNRRIRKVNPAGIIATVAGTGALGFEGDGGPATSAGFDPRGTTHQGIAVDNAGNFYFADIGNFRIRKVNAAGIISTVAGYGNPIRGINDGGPATNGGLNKPAGLTLDGAGNLYIADTVNNRVRKVDTAGIITTIAGSGNTSFSGDGGPAINATLNTPSSVAVDNAGNVYIADFGNHRIRKVSTSGIITTFAGGAAGGAPGFSGDGGPATSAQLSAPGGVAVDSAGNVFIADSANVRIRKVDTAGIITSVAGNLFGVVGDGGPATNTVLRFPMDVALDAAGNIYIADGSDHRVRKVSSGAAGPQPGGPSASVSGVVNGASFEPGFAAGQWVTIRGTNLASVTRTLDFVNGSYPTQADGVSVTINGRPAALQYLSPTQLNVIAPDLTGSGAAQVVVTSNGATASFTAQLQPAAPAFFPWPGGYAVATDPNFQFKVKAGTFAGLSTTPARPGDVIILWGTGFGPTTPAVAAGRQTPADRAYSVAGAVRVTIGGVQAEFFGAALAPGFAGLYQIAVRVPELPDGDHAVVAETGGAASPGSTRLTVQR